MSAPAPRGPDSPGCFKCKAPGQAHAFFCSCGCHGAPEPKRGLGLSPAELEPFIRDLHILSLVCSDEFVKRSELKWGALGFQRGGD